ncbi:MAG TPA: sugar ABC transporter permease, partial [Myxococcales bacterium]|nr:sugar ABC transporter permease [Myxococcales bacterium]
EILLALGVVEEGLAWTADPDLALAAVVAVDVWKTTPFMTLLILAALQTLPEDVYEAAQIDGARPVRVFLQITLPMIRGPLLVAVIFRMLDALRVFDVFYVLTSNSVDTTPMAGYARQKMFEHQELGAGAAAASVLFGLIAAFTAVYLVAARVKVEPEAA